MDTQKNPISRNWSPALYSILCKCTIYLNSWIGSLNENLKKCNAAHQRVFGNDCQVYHFHGLLGLIMCIRHCFFIFIRYMNIYMEYTYMYIEA